MSFEKITYSPGDVLTSDQMNKIQDAILNTSKVGDILISSRTDVGDKYLPTNGDSIDMNAYPELYAQFEDQITNIAPFPSDAGSIGKIKYLNGYWVVTGRAKFNGTQYAAVFISDDPLTSWTAVQVCTSTSNYISDVNYHDGLWVGVGCNTNRGMPAFYYAPDPFGTWGIWEDTTKTSNYAYQMTEVHYIDGKWWAFGNQDASTIGYYTTNPTLGWVWLTMGGNGFAYRDNARYLNYVDGLYVLGGDWYTGSGTTEYPSVYYTTDPINVAWTQKTITTEVVEKQITSLAYGGGTWVAVVTDNDGVNILTATDVTGDWTLHKTVIRYASSANVYYINGLWYLCAQHGQATSEGTGVFITADPNGEWTKIREHSSSTDWRSLSMCEHDGLIIVNRCYNDKLLGVMKRYLPTLSHNDLHTYIKAKE